MIKKILFWFFLFELLNTGLGGGVAFFIALLIYGVYKIYKNLNYKTELELILDTYKVNEEYEKGMGKDVISDKPLSLEKKLKSLPNKNGAIQFKKLTAMTQNFKDIISLDIKEDKKTINDYKYAVEQVYQAIQGNLQHYYLVMKSVEPVNSNLMYKVSSFSEDEKKDLAQEWSTLFSKQKKRARNVLVQNEQAITQLYIFITDIVNKKPDNSMNKALDKLTQLTKATKQYSDEFLPSPYL